jgi:Glucodextranase, domain B/PASTA domain
MRAARSTAIALACSGLVAACGGVRAPAAPPVRLSIERPLDGTSILASQVLVSGSAAGAGTVVVAGRQVPVIGGAFTAKVAVRPGGNVIDVLAGAPGAHAAMRAVRVYRELPVEVPRVEGLSASAASSELRRLGLRAQVHDGSGFFQSLLPLSKHVCDSGPAAGRRVAPGSAVALRIAKIC